MIRRILSALFVALGRSKTAPVGNEEEAARQAEAILDGFRLQFRRRLEAGLPITIEEWADWDEDDAGTVLQNLWLECRQEYMNESMALEAQFLASALRGNVLAEDAVYDRLPEESKDAIVRERSKVAAAIKKAHGKAA